MKRRPRTWPRTALVGGCTAALALTGLTATVSPATAVAAAPAAATTAADASAVTVTPDPSYRGEAFEGWGTSLVWFANATGDYPDEIREELADLVFGKDGLNLNIARYNVGGGNAPDVPEYLRAGGAVEGWWQAPEGTTRDDTDWWDAEDEADWNADADATQRWWVDAIKSDITTWEAFSNSPPYFQTVSGYVSGGLSSTADQIDADKVDEFAAYLVGAVERLEAAEGITVDTIDPLNEPNTNYWSTTLGSDGNPTGGRQEGAHASPALQEKVIEALADELSTSQLDAVVSAMDETNPGTWLTDWNAYSSATKADVDQLNVHTYGTSQRTAVRDVAKSTGKTLWMSEYEGNWGTGQSFTDMAPGLGIAQHITDDLRELEPTAWVFWQPVEDYDNMKPGAETGAGGNWGSVQVSFACDQDDTLETCPVYTNTKFDTIRNYTHYIEPGDHLIGVDDTSSTAAVDDDGVDVVHVNAGDTAQTVTLDLSKFGTVSADATVRPIVTSSAGALVKGKKVHLDGATSATLEVPADSVTTFVVTGVSGVADDAALVQTGHVYRLTGTQSGKSLTPATSGQGAVIRTSATDAAQLWQLVPVSGGTSHTAAYQLVTADGARRVVDTGGTAALQAVDGAPAASAQWMLSTTGDGTYTLVNKGTGTLLEVSGQSSADGATVSVYQPNSGANQRWTITDETVVDVAAPAVFTTTGTTPELPGEVTATLADGSTSTMAVTWRTPDADVWSTPGTVAVNGTASDVLGGSHEVTATVSVGTLVSARTAAAKTYPGAVPVLPATVDVVTSAATVVPREVTWSEVEGADFAATGVVAVTGTVADGHGGTLPATVKVQVTDPVDDNVATQDGVVLDASYTEPGYSTDGLVNGVVTDKAWSTWKSGTQNTSEWVSVTFPEEREVTGVAATFYYDGRESWPATLTVQALGDDGSWTDVSDTVEVPSSSTGPTVTVDITDVTTTALRLSFVNRSSMYITMSELEVYAPTAGTSGDAALASIALDGVEVEDFTSTDTTYTVRVDAGTPTPVVSAEAVDPYAVVGIVQADEVPGRAVVTVTSEDGSATLTYTVKIKER